MKRVICLIALASLLLLSGCAEHKPDKNEIRYEAVQDFLHEIYEYGDPADMVDIAADLADAAREAGKDELAEKGDHLASYLDDIQAYFSYVKECGMD